MKIRNLLIVSAVTALATVNLLGADVALSPRALDHGAKAMAGPNNDPNLTAANPVPASPRLRENQIKTTSLATAEAPSCAENMTGSSPKTIGVCAEHPGAAMPCCTVAVSR